MTCVRTLDRCVVARLRDGLLRDDARALDWMLQSPEGWPAQTLADALRKNGFEVSKDSIRLHRNGTCACRRQKKESTS